MASRSTPPETRTERKRARTRRELLRAARRVLTEKGVALTIRDVTAEADVAVGTFYNYFDGPDALIDAVMREELLEIAASEAVGGSDPAARVAATAVRILERALADEQWAGLALRLVHRPGEPNQLNAYLRDDLVEGFAAERFAFGADDATLDLASGLLVMTLRRVVAGDAGREVVAPAVARLLCALGVPGAEAASLAKAAVS